MLTDGTLGQTKTSTSNKFISKIFLSFQAVLITLMFIQVFVSLIFDAIKRGSHVMIDGWALVIEVTWRFVENLTPRLQLRSLVLHKLWLQMTSAKDGKRSNPGNSGFDFVKWEDEEMCCPSLFIVNAADLLLNWICCVCHLKWVCSYINKSSEDVDRLLWLCNIQSLQILHS